MGIQIVAKGTCVLGRDRHVVGAKIFLKPLALWIPLSLEWVQADCPSAGYLLNTVSHHLYNRLTLYPRELPSFATKSGLFLF